MKSRFVGTGRIARMYGVSGETVRQWVKLGKLSPVPTPGKHMRFDLHALQKKEVRDR
jgi:excisionase family DNA binding protein